MLGTKKCMPTSPEENYYKVRSSLETQRALDPKTEFPHNIFLMIVYLVKGVRFTSSLKKDAHFPRAAFSENWPCGSIIPPPLLFFFPARPFEPFLSMTAKEAL